jgi:amino acid adenylation domain-containing protein
VIDLSRAQRPDGGLAVASRAQESFWFLDRLTPDSPTGNAYRAYRVTGRLDLGALRTVWWELLRRHEVLRSVAVDEGGELRFRVDEPVDDSWIQLNLPEDAADHWCTDWTATPLDLATGPLARLAVVGLGSSQYRLVLLAHRTVADDRSMSIIAEELSACYGAAIAGRDVRAALPAPAAQYADYALWQRGRLAAPDFRHHIDWWLATCTSPPSSPSLATDRERPSGPSWRGHTARFGWDDTFTAAITALATAQRTTVDMALLAGFAALLCRHSGVDRIAVGVPVSWRPNAEVDRLVGPCANPVLVSVDLAGAPTFRDLLDRTAETAAGAFAHGEVPIGQLARALLLDRDPRRLPFWGTMFVPSGDDSTPEFAGARVHRHHIDNGTAATDLTFTVDHVTPSIAGSLNCRASLLDHSSAQAILDQLHTFLTAAVDDPDCPVAELPLADTDAIVRAADQIAAAEPPDRGVHELVRAQALRRPDSVAVAWRGEIMTYRELVSRAVRVADRLRAADVRGRPVAVRLGPGPDLAVALLGVLDAGAHVMCLGPADMGERARAMLSELRPARMIVRDEPAQDALVQWYQSQLSGQVLNVTVDGAPADAPRHPVETGALAYVAYTSGSTGKPKGIAQSHATLAQFVTWFGTRFGLAPGARLAQWAAPGYDAGLCEVFAALTLGATLCPVPEDIRANPDKLVDWLVAEQISVLQTVPSFARELLRVIAGRRPALRPYSVSHLLLAGEALPGELANELRAALPWLRLVNLYGPTESILATWYPITDELTGTAPIGEPIPGRQVLVLDEEDRPCPAGVTGQIAIRSPYLVSGYVGRSDTDAFSPPRGLPEGNWYRTGDFGRLRWDGQLEFRGRVDFQVKLLGTRMELSDIEATLAGHESISECAVLPVPGPDGLVGKLVAHVVPVGSDGSAKIWRARLRQRFGTTMLPVTFNVHNVPLPRNIGGKIDRRALRGSDIRSGHEPTPQHTEVAQGIAAIWTDLTGVANIELTDTYCGIGGDSLLALRMLHLVGERFGVEVPLWDYLANPSLADLAATIAAPPVRRDQHQGTNVDRDTVTTAPRRGV